MSKYEPLACFLRQQLGDRVTLSFKEIDKLVDGGLPQSAYDYRPWWANRHDGRGSQSAGWQSAGWETCDVRVADGGSVTFKRVRKNGAAELTRSSLPDIIIEAKRMIAAAKNVPVDNIEIHIRF